MARICSLHHYPNRQYPLLNRRNNRTTSSTLQRNKLLSQRLQTKKKLLKYKIHPEKVGTASHKKTSQLKIPKTSQTTSSTGHLISWLFRSRRKCKTIIFLKINYPLLYPMNLNHWWACQLRAVTSAKFHSTAGRIILISKTRKQWKYSRKSTTNPSETLEQTKTRQTPWRQTNPSCQEMP